MIGTHWNYTSLDNIVHKTRILHVKGKIDEILFLDGKLIKLYIDVSERKVYATSKTKNLIVSGRFHLTLLFSSPANEIKMNGFVRSQWTQKKVR